MNALGLIVDADVAEERDLIERIVLMLTKMRPAPR
jgi:hypothetical protein